jgi:hypothetical protein
VVAVGEGNAVDVAMDVGWGTGVSVGGKVGLGVGVSVNASKPDALTGVPGRDISHHRLTTSPKDSQIILRMNHLHHRRMSGRYNDVPGTMVR